MAYFDALVHVKFKRVDVLENSIKDTIFYTFNKQTGPVSEFAVSADSNC